MPQLNPAPWFAILVFSWFIFLVFLPPKVLAHTLPNEPSAQSVESTHTQAWTWPWS